MVTLVTQRSVFGPSQAAVSSPLHLEQPTIDGNNSASSRRRSLRLRLLRICLIVGLGAGLILGAINQRELLSASLTNLRSLTLTSLVLVVACWFTMVVSRGLVYRLTHHQFRFHHGVALDQVNLAAANGLPGGAVIGIAARVKMCRKLGHRSEQGALTVFASGQAFAAGRWVCLIFVVLAAMMTRGIQSIDLIELCAAVIALSLSGVTWAVLTIDSRVSRVILETCENLLTRTSSTKGAFRRARFRASTTKFRSCATELVRNCSLKLVSFGALSTLLGALILVVVIDDLSPEPVVSIDILRAYLIARVATSFIPTPGAVGILDGALTVGLMGKGIDPTVAVSAVVVYRAFTFALPIAIGSFVYLVWSRKDNARTSLTPDDDGSSTPSCSTTPFTEIANAA